MLYWINSKFWVNWRKLEIGPLLPYFYTFRDPKLTAKNDFTFRAFPFTRNTFYSSVSLLKNPQYCVLFSPPTLYICLSPKGQFYNTTYFFPHPPKFFSFTNLRPSFLCLQCTSGKFGVFGKILLSVSFAHPSVWHVSQWPVVKNLFKKN